MLYINICKVISIPTFKLVYHCSILHYLLYIKCCTKYIIIILRTITSNKYILYIKYIYIQYSIFSIYGSMFINSCQPFEWSSDSYGREVHEETDSPFRFWFILCNKWGQVTHKGKWCFRWSRALQISFKRAHWWIKHFI